MKFQYITYVILFISNMSFSQSRQKLITFESEDGLEISADLYMIHPNTAPFIVLFHQANWSRGEYNEIAPKLNAMGYNCLAVDLRSGGMVNNVTNLTKINASKAMKSTQYVDALADMRSAVKYVKNNFAADKLIIWGSSYSSSLSLVLAAELDGIINGVLAFSPAEYFSSQGKPRNFVTAEAGKISQPVFITSARSEKGSWWGIYISMVSDKKTYYLPNTVGNHGSKALWEQYPDSNGYWDAVTAFLKSI
jgi:alpha-beta hydrolase superfamily lysophospholipase